MAIFKGSCVALVTPFNETGVNFDKLKELIEWHIGQGTDAILVCGTTGEATTMSLQERKDTIEFTVKTVKGRIPVIAGTGSNNTKASIEMSIWSEKMGVDGLLVITPYYNKTSQKGLYEHFKAINDAVKTPIILYNVPSRTNMNISPDLLLKLSDLNNIVAIKEASGNFSQIAEMKALCGDKISIYSGNDDQIIPLLSLGGEGVISVLANVLPKETHEMCELYLNGKTKEALDLQLKYLNLANSLFIETNPIPVKTAMNLMGFECGELRLPLCDMEEVNLSKLKDVLKENNLLK
ncbi:4-hydroxy-tetrahydrodipicolinate synthase [Clostridium massiliamazoniense]|uniref:4-hydroxy-tetrahydrodipicolinate synthase n=1 Tax=Clostridium massiliamazoniense TaxID=1347366 RepID=UPI0006D7F688|nr:4-hydroxy-tetrahydrodipicolinate synthase [Clostridium massiliamazoniense]